MAAILKSLKHNMSNLNENCLILMKFGSQKRIPIKMTTISAKFKIFEIQDGCRLPFSKS